MAKVSTHLLHGFVLCSSTSFSLFKQSFLTCIVQNTEITLQSPYLNFISAMATSFSIHIYIWQLFKSIIIMQSVLVYITGGRIEQSNKQANCSLCQLHRSVGHDRYKLSRTCERFPICDDNITENDWCVIKIIVIHCKCMCTSYRGPN